MLLCSGGSSALTRPGTATSITLRLRLHSLGAHAASVSNGEFMAIESEEELRQAVNQASNLLQDIHGYCAENGLTLADVPEAKVRFPRGFIRTANFQRTRFPFLNNHALKSNIAYTLILSDTVLWISLRTDISGTAKDMLNKLFIFLVGSVIESVTKEYLKGICGKNFNRRLQYLSDQGVINEELEQEVAWVWETRNRMHLFQLDGPEYENEYHEHNHRRTIKAFRGLLAELTARGPMV